MTARCWTTSRSASARCHRNWCATCCRRAYCSTLDITIQAPGVDTFNAPLKITFPNVFNAAPGSQLNILSFDHTTGKLVISGTGTVSADGKSVVSDPGSGVMAPGWHGLVPPGVQVIYDIVDVCRSIANRWSIWPSMPSMYSATSNACHCPSSPASKARWQVPCWGLRGPLLALVWVSYW
jgi:hypothetical protein